MSNHLTRQEAKVLGSTHITQEQSRKDFMSRLEHLIEIFIEIIALDVVVLVVLLFVDEGGGGSVVAVVAVVVVVVVHGDA